MSASLVCAYWWKSSERLSWSSCFYSFRRHWIYTYVASWSDGCIWSGWSEKSFSLILFFRPNRKYVSIWNSIDHTSLFKFAIHTITWEDGRFYFFAGKIKWFIVFFGSPNFTIFSHSHSNWSRGWNITTNYITLWQIFLGFFFTIQIFEHIIIAYAILI